MGITHRLKSAITAFRFSSIENPVRYGGGYFYSITNAFTGGNKVDPFTAFTVPEFNAVANIRARMKARGTLRIVSRETGKDMKNYEYLIKVLRNPNWYQSYREFKRQSSLFRDGWGNEYLYFNKAFGVPFTSVRSLYTLPPANVITSTPQDKPFYLYDTPVISYKFQWGNDLYDLDQSAMVQLNDNRIRMEKGNWVTGESKLQSLKGPINNIIAAYEARNVLISNRGAVGMLSPEGKDVAGNIPMTEAEKDTVQKEYRDKYGLSSDKWSILITSQAMKWQQMSIDDPQKLGLFPEVEVDFQRICDAYGVDRDMFGNQKGATWENKKQGERATWNNTIIPEEQEWIDCLNDTFETNGKAWVIIEEFNDIPALQENLKERAQGLQMITNALTTALNASAIDVAGYQAELAKYGIIIPSGNGNR